MDDLWDKQHTKDKGQNLKQFIFTSRSLIFEINCINIKNKFWNNKIQIEWVLPA